MVSLNKIDAAIKDKDYASAKYEINLAITLMPDFYLYYLRLCEVHLITGDNDNAERAIRKALKIKKNALTVSKAIEFEKATGIVIFPPESQENTELNLLNTEKLQESIASLQEKLAFYVPRQKYSNFYSPVLALANFGRKVLDIKDELRSDVYISLLPNSLQASFNLRDYFGDGMVVCDNVENVDRDKHSLPPNYPPQVMRFYNQMGLGALMQCDKLMTVSSALAKDLQRFSKPTLTLINSRNYEETLPSNRLKEEFKLDDNARIIFASGNVVSGFEPILDALAKLPENYIFIGFIRVKPNDYAERIKNLIESLGIEHRVFIRDFVPYEDLIDYAQQAHVGITIADESNPNAAVALPNRFFDYLCAEIPIVMHAMPDVVALTEQYNIGKIVYETTAEHWQSAITEVVENQSIFKPNVLKAKAEICWEKQEEELYNFLGRPKSVTMVGIRDLTQYQRFKRVAQSLFKQGCKVKMYTLSKSTNFTALIPEVEYYIVNDLHDPNSKPQKLLIGASI